MTQIIFIGGKKQSGKSTLATAIYGYYLTSNGIIPNAHIDESGNMAIIYNEDKQEGIQFDINNTEDWFVDFCKKNIWGHIKHYDIAFVLKETLINLFGLERRLVYGSNEDKEQPTYIQLKILFPYMSQKTYAKYYEDGESYATIRQMLEIFGSDICRTIEPECHVASTGQRITNDNPEIAIITDGRFDNELHYFQSRYDNVFSIKLTRDPFNSDASSEQGLANTDDSEYSVVVPPDVSLFEKNDLVISKLIEAKILKKI